MQASFWDGPLMALPLRYPLGNLVARRMRTGLTVGVIALVVVATTLFGSLISSLKRTLVSTGDPRNLIVLRKGSTNDGSSILPLEAFQGVRFFDGVARDAAGDPLVSPELVVQPFFKTASGGRENAPPCQWPPCACLLASARARAAISSSRHLTVSLGRFSNFRSRHTVWPECANYGCGLMRSDGTYWYCSHNRECKPREAGPCDVRSGGRAVIASKSSTSIRTR